MRPDCDSPEGHGNGPRVSKLAVIALVLSPLLFLSCAALAQYWLNATWKTGWDGLGQLIGFVVWVHIVGYGGSLAAVVSLILALLGIRRIRRMPEKLRGTPQARMTVFISVTSLVGVWGAVGVFVAANHIREEPERAAMVEILAAHRAAAEYAVKHPTFPDTLGDVVGAEIAARHIYLGNGLPSRYADYRIAHSASIVLMHSKEDINGKHFAVSASGMSHEWTETVLRKALRESERLRGEP